MQRYGSLPDADRDEKLSDVALDVFGGMEQQAEYRRGQLAAADGTGFDERTLADGAKFGESAGDLFAEIQIVLPDDLTEDERRRLAEITAGRPPNPRAELRW